MTMIISRSIQRQPKIISTIPRIEYLSRIGAHIPDILKQVQKVTIMFMSTLIQLRIFFEIPRVWYVSGTGALGIATVVNRGC